MNSILEQYNNAKFVYFTCLLTDEKNPEGVYKKKAKEIPAGYTLLTEPLVNKHHNCYCLLMGTELPDNKQSSKQDTYYLIGLDIDNKETATTKNGIGKIKELFKIHKYKPNTPKAKTGNNGLHYLFKVNENELQQLKSSYTELRIDNEKYAIDAKIKNQLLYVEPTVYQSGSETKHYQWINKNFDSIERLPTFLYNILLSQHSLKTNNNILKPINNTNNSAINEENHMMTEPINIEFVQALLNCLSTLRIDNYSSWLRLGFVLKCIGAPISMYVDISKKSSKYTEGCCEIVYNGCRRRNALTIKTLLFWAKLDDAEQYATLIKEHYQYWLQLNNNNNNNNNTIQSAKPHNCIEINEQFLSLKQCKPLQDAIRMFFSSNSATGACGKKYLVLSLVMAQVKQLY
jgi:hypothetical protein